jgi:N-acetyl-gamma-glutamyl-phosphate reductase
VRPTIFIDGEAGTTGLQIRARLMHRNDLEIVSIAPEKRKDESERRRLLNGVDLAILCLPDDAAKDAVRWIENTRTRVLDASTAHRVAPGWVFGFPELAPGQSDAIRQARFVANPGCYSTGAIALLRPLTDAGVLPADYPVVIQGVSGYSGGGRQLIDAFHGRGEHHLHGPYRAYGLSLNHKHLPEIKRYARLELDPIFTPAVAAFAQGMIVQVPLHLSSLPSRPTANDLQAVFERHYAGQRFVRVLPLELNAPAHMALDPESLNGTNMLEVMMFANQAKSQALLVARLDNLGKGASGAAAQNVDVMLGLSGNHDYGCMD